MTFKTISLYFWTFLEFFLAIFFDNRRIFKEIITFAPTPNLAVCWSFLVCILFQWTELKSSHKRFTREIAQSFFLALKFLFQLFQMHFNHKIV